MALRPLRIEHVAELGAGRHYRHAQRRDVSSGTKFALGSRGSGGRSHHRAARRHARSTWPLSVPVEFLDLDDLIDLARRLLGDPPPVRDFGLLTAAAARPQTTVGGNDAYPTIWLKAASLLQSIVGNHALVDGNKRLGWLATAVFLEINDASVATAANDDVYTLVMQVARSELPLLRDR